MKTRNLTLATLAALAMLGLSATAQADDATCELKVTKSGDGFTIEPVVTADKAMEGSFDLAISGGGTQIDQSGGFAASAGIPTSLGMMNVAGGKSYTAKLKLAWNGGSVNCAEKMR